MSDQTITSLIEKLEGAEGPSLVLDGEIWCAVNGYTFVMWDGAGCVYRRASDGGISHEQASRIRPFSASLDAALALAERVLPGWEFGTYINRPDVNGRRFTKIEAHRWQDVSPEYAFACASSKAATPALAVCAAVLRAQSEAR